MPFGLGTATLRNFEAVLANPAIRRAFANSFMLAGAAGVISAVVALPLAWLSLTARNPLARVLSWLCWMRSAFIASSRSEP